MKAVILFAILISIVPASGQSIKELLYGGKLKSDTGTVIRKGDDLSTKIDTTTKKPVAEPQKTSTTPLVVTRDSTGTIVTNSIDPANPATPATDPGATATKDNNKVWKTYMDELTGTLRTEVLTSKKIKSGSYSVLIEYEIGVDGQIGVTNVSSSPENDFLEEQVKQRLTMGAPTLTPLLGTNGKPRKAVKKQIITLSKI